MIISENSIDTEQRSARRYKIKLESEVLALATDNSENGDKTYYPFMAQLSDISLTGLALIVSVADACEIQALGSDITIRIMLQLTSMSIETKLTPVRYHLIEDEKRVLVGSIMTMPKKGMQILMKFIEDFDSD